MQLDELNKGKKFNMNGGLRVKFKNNQQNRYPTSIIPKLNISEIVKQIGINAKNMNSKGIYQLKKRLIDWKLD